MTTKPPSALPSLKPSPLAGWIEVFKAGSHTDSAGKRMAFGVAELDQMVANHVEGSTPAVLGHPQHDDPAYAWVEGFKREGDSLYAQFKDINPAFDAGVASGAYRNRSVAVYKDAAQGWRVRHVGWLGAVPPAIDGLKPLTFAAEADTHFEFAAPGYSLVWGLESVAKLLRGLREQMIAKDGLEAADSALPQWQIDGAMESAATARREFDEADPARALGRLYARPNLDLQPDGETMTVTQAQLDAANEAAAAAKAEADAAKADAAAARAEFAKANTDLTALRSAEQTTRISAQVEGWKAAGKLTAAEATGMAQYMASLEALSTSEFTFSKADGAQGKLTPYQFHVASIEARAPSIKLGQQSAAGDDAALDVDDTAAIVGKAHAFMASEQAAGRVVNIAMAVDRVTKGAGA